MLFSVSLLGNKRHEMVYITGHIYAVHKIVHQNGNEHMCMKTFHFFCIFFVRQKKKNGKLLHLGNG